MGDVEIVVFGRIPDKKRAGEQILGPDGFVGKKGCYASFTPIILIKYPAALVFMPSYLIAMARTIAPSMDSAEQPMFLPSIHMW